MNDSNRSQPNDRLPRQPSYPDRFSWQPTQKRIPDPPPPPPQDSSGPESRDTD